MQATHGQRTAEVLRLRPMTAPPIDSIRDLATAVASDYVGEWDANQRAATAEAGCLADTDEEKLDAYCAGLAREIGGGEEYAAALAGAVTEHILDILSRCGPHIITNAADVRQQLAPLYKRFSGQTQPQSAYLEIDPAKRTMTATYNSEIGNAVPFDVWHRRVLRISVSPYVHGTVLADLLESAELAELAAAICDGHSIEYDGSNRVGLLTEDGKIALDEMETILSNLTSEGSVNVCAPDEWIPSPDYTGITADSTDEQITTLAAECIASAAMDMTLIDGDMADWLTELRRRLREEGQA